MKLAIIQAAVMAALFLIAAVVCYHCGYVGGRVDGETKQSSVIWSLESEVAR